MTCWLAKRRGIMEVLTIKTFEELSMSRYGEVITFFVHKDNYVLIIIPQWDWSFMWDFERYTDNELREACAETLLDLRIKNHRARIYNMRSERHAHNITDRFHWYLTRGE